MKYERGRLWCGVIFAAIALLFLGGCAMTYGEGSPSGTTTYTKGDWVHKQTQKKNAHKALALRVKHVLDADPLLQQAAISFRLKGSTVVLLGKLFDMTTYRHAIGVVRHVDGVEAVSSRIELNLSQ